MVHISSIINEIIRTIFHLFIFSLRKILHHKKNAKQATFPSYEPFVHEKIVAFVLLVSFYLLYVFYAAKVFLKKINR